MLILSDKLFVCACYEAMIEFRLSMKL